MSAIGTQVHAKAKPAMHRSGPCPWLCNPVPTNVPSPGRAQAVIHPRKDVFVLKVKYYYLLISLLYPLISLLISS